MSRPQAGFTLLEVVVAVAVVGAGFAVGLAAMSGSLRLLRSATEYREAMLLARAAMTEAIAYPDYDILDDREREVYQGVEYAYRVEFRPVRLAGSDNARAAPLPVALEQISVDVFWGEGRAKTYRLVTYRMPQIAAAASAASLPRARGSAAPPAAGDGSTARDGPSATGETGRQDDRLRP